MKNYKIADLSVNMNVSGRTLLQSEKFAVSDQPDVSADIVFPDYTQRICALLADRPGATYELMEYILTGFRFYKSLVNFDGFILHSSAVVYQGKAYLFSADSGVGKSTHTSLWMECFEGAYLLNDDKPAIRFVDGKAMVYGTPWNGKSKNSVNERVPLGGICFLYRDDHNSIRKLSTSEALSHLIRQTAHKKFSEATLTKLLRIWDKLLSEYSIYKMGCLPNVQAAQLAYKTMKGE